MLALRPAVADGNSGSRRGEARRSSTVKGRFTGHRDWTGPRRRDVVDIAQEIDAITPGFLDRDRPTVRLILRHHRPSKTGH